MDCCSDSEVLSRQTRHIRDTDLPSSNPTQATDAAEYEPSLSINMVPCMRSADRHYIATPWTRRYLGCCFLLSCVALVVGGCATIDPEELWDCATYGIEFFRPIGDQRTDRFLGKVQENTARCRGGRKAVVGRDRPWTDWQNYWATRDTDSKASGLGAVFGPFGPNGRGIRGALLDLEYQRMEMIKFNLFDNSGTYENYVNGRLDIHKRRIEGRILTVWPEMKLDRGYKETKEGPDLYVVVGGKEDEKENGESKQRCQGDLIRFRMLTGICNDLDNPRMGSTDQPFARNVEFDATFPDLGKNPLARNRHGDRLGLLKPDPQVISRKLFTRVQPNTKECKTGLESSCFSPDPHFDYKKANTFNVLAAFWIQFMTHDWFSHLKNGHNRQINGNEPDLMPVGCSKEEAFKLGCRPDDLVDKAYLLEENPKLPDLDYFKHQGKHYLTRAYEVTQNTVTAWWDASQIYGYDEDSLGRVERDRNDPAKLRMLSVGHRVQHDKDLGYLPKFEESLTPTKPKINKAWSGQEATAFPENWNIGLSFFHNVFAREHNRFVDAFREQTFKAKETSDKSDDDCGLRNPNNPSKPVLWWDVTDDELFQITRLVVSAEIAKIHTIEWTTQLLYNEPLHRGMNANWNGLFKNYPLVNSALKVAMENHRKSPTSYVATQWYSAFAGGPGILGLGNQIIKCRLVLLFCKDVWSIEKLDDVNGGIHHFGSPFNFPEEFVTVYRLHPLLPDLIEYRELKDEEGNDSDPTVTRPVVPVVETFRGEATNWMRDKGLANWALTMGYQRLGRLTLQNHPQFLQNLPMPRLQTKTNQIDVAALDLIRDRERGIPRFNEFRRQYGIKQFTSFDDFIDTTLDPTDPIQGAELDRQRRLVQVLREIYGRHKCDWSKVITESQLNDDQTFINDCLGHRNGDMVDNIEDLDTVVGWLAEPVRPHGFAISETQFQVFILNASRRLLSDRFFTSSFRKEFYSQLGVDWVNKNGKVMDKNGQSNWCGEKEEVSPLKCVLLRTVPELKQELSHVVNVFDVWCRDRGKYYSLEWKGCA